MDMSKLLNPRLVELMEADEQGRVVILPTKAEEQRFLVERALQIRLLDWQVAYIWGGSGYLMPGRGTGKTLANVIRLCLSQGDPLHMYRSGKDECVCDGNQSHEYFKIYRKYVRDTYSKLQLYGGLELRTIYFSAEDALADERGLYGLL